MHSDSPARARDITPPQVGSEELAEGLMLVRASTLKMIRLQLAMERNDRRVALEAVDELVALDRRLEGYLAEVPASGEQLLFRNGLNTERAALNREKLTLAAEVIRREAPAAPVELDAPDATSWDEFEFSADEPERGHRAIKWLVFLFVLLTAAAGAAYAFAGPEAQATMIAELRALS
jgi:hypothetical protein